ncbi:TPA: pantocin A family RiPP [Escherichia coli]
MISFKTLTQRISAITEENVMYTKGQTIVLN